MQKVLNQWMVFGTARDGDAVKLQWEWLELEASRCVEVALGVVVPEEWTMGESLRNMRPLK